MTIIKAAAVQLSPVLYGRKAPWTRFLGRIIARRRQGVQFATFPET